VGLRHGVSASLISTRSMPEARTASVTITPPAWETTPDPAASTWTRG
jgi:hypothetical protein